MNRPPRILAALTSLALAQACSDRSPTGPSSAIENDRTSSSASSSDVARRPRTRLIAPRGGASLLPVGLWGGEEAELIVTPSGATARLFCAHGQIDASLASDETGRFSLLGTLVREGGPVPIDDTPFRLPARYSGWTDGRTMILSVSVEGFPQPLGPFKLTLGRPSGLGPCPIL